MLSGTPKQKKLGDDCGCFASALASVRRFGGVLEHPADSHAWAAHGLNKPPRSGGWVSSGDGIGYSCCVEQGAYGHRARKRTWLYSAHTSIFTLCWIADRDFGPPPGLSAEARRRAIKTGICQRMSKKQRAATPIPFRDLLLSIARSAYIFRNGF